jgi:hypothetical protein
MGAFSMCSDFSTDLGVGLSANVWPTAAVRRNGILPCLPGFCPGLFWALPTVRCLTSFASRALDVAYLALPTALWSLPTGLCLPCFAYRLWMKHGQHGRNQHRSVCLNSYAIEKSSAIYHICPNWSHLCRRTAAVFLRCLLPPCGNVECVGT